jgi:hypothetical protein
MRWGDRKLDNPAATYGYVAIDDRGRLARSLPCIDCGYDLRSTPADGGCPECGAAVDRSVRHAVLGSATRRTPPRTRWGRLTWRIARLETAACVAIESPVTRLVLLMPAVGVGVLIAPLTVPLWPWLPSPSPVASCMTMTLLGGVWAWSLWWAVRTESPRTALGCLVVLVGSSAVLSAMIVTP